ncbi:ABC transporter ATP-binding protein [Streptococcus pluranimalium]|uniref:ABC transporter ATP-binding protein n=1 Tax=Streptococcus pluranimalium TaxID=82348 RepID=UPI003F693A78
MSRLSISNLTKVVKDKTLLNNICLTLNYGQIYGVIGDNGAGKTTLFRCILGLSKPIGTVALDDKIVNSFNYNDFLKKVGVVFPFPDSFGAYTVKEAFENHSRYYSCPFVDVESYLKQFGLNVSSGDKISRFSLGMKQRLNIALACLHNPEILILDEPFNGLDREGIILLQQLLKDFKKQGKLIIISSHSFAELEKITDHLIVIQQGEVLADTNVMEVKRQGFGTFEQFYREIKEVHSV